MEKKVIDEEEIFIIPYMQRRKGGKEEKGVRIQEHRDPFIPVVFIIIYSISRTYYQSTMLVCSLSCLLEYFRV